MKKAAVKIIVVVAMAAAVFVNAVIPVSAINESNITCYMAIQYDQGRITDLVSITNDMQLNGMGADETLFAVCYGEFEPNTTYQISLILKTDDSASVSPYVKNPYTYSNSFITDNPITSSYNTYPSNLFQIPSSNVSGTTYALYATSYYINFMITFNTNNLPLFEGNQYIYIGFKSTNTTSTTIKFAGYTISSISDQNNTVFNEINNNLNSINNSVQQVINNQTNTSTQLTQIVNNTTEIKNITNTISNQVSTVISNIQDTNTKLDTVNNNLTQIINIGEGNSIPNNVANLEIAQQQLHQSEEALTNKSESLASRASSGINTAKTKTTEFIGTITPAVTAVSSTITQAIDTLPSEIQPMVYSMPLLSFAVWLIGLKR